MFHKGITQREDSGSDLETSVEQAEQMHSLWSWPQVVMLRSVFPAVFQVTLAGYYFAFRYCPEGKHVARREGSRTPHEGTIEFISQDSHRGAGESVSYTSW